MGAVFLNIIKESKNLSLFKKFFLKFIQFFIKISTDSITLNFYFSEKVFSLKIFEILKFFALSSVFFNTLKNIKKFLDSKFKFARNNNIASLSLSNLTFFLFGIFFFVLLFIFFKSGITAEGFIVFVFLFLTLYFFSFFETIMLKDIWKDSALNKIFDKLIENSKVKK